MNRERRGWFQSLEDFERRHPAIFVLLLLLLAFLAGPLMIAATNVTAVLYKDF